MIDFEFKLKGFDNDAIIRTLLSQPKALIAQLQPQFRAQLDEAGFDDVGLEVLVDRNKGISLHLSGEEDRIEKAKQILSKG